MPRDPQPLVFVGIKNTLVALDERTGGEIWRAKLRGSDFVSVLWDGECLLAANQGEVFRIDPRSGAILWHNQLKGLGRGVVSLATTRRAVASPPTESAEAERKRDARQAAAVAAAS